MAHIKMHDDLAWEAGPKRHRDPEPWEVQVLALISEHVAIPMDLLARLLKVPRERAVSLMQEFTGHRWVNVKQLLAADEPWVWLRQAGSDHANTGFRRLTPTLIGLPHRRAVCAIRVRLEADHPKGTWISERALKQQRGHSRHIPDGAFDARGVDGEVERWAVEAELSAKPISEYRAIAREHGRRYDRLLYFCGPQAARRLRQTPGLADSLNITVYDFFEEPQRLENFQWAASPTSGPSRAPAARPAQPWEVSVLRLISEQHAMSIEHLGRFLKCDYARAERIADHLGQAGFIGQGRGPADESPWLWVTRSGARSAGTGLRYELPRPTNADRLHLENEARLYVAERDRSARWWSKRLLRKGTGRTHLPTAIVESEGERCAVEIESWRDTEDLIERYNQRCREYPTVLVFCSPRRVKTFVRLRETHGWTNLHVQALRPRGERRKSRPRRAIRYVDIRPEDLPQDALEVVAEAEYATSPPRVQASAYARGPGAPRWRVTTDRHEWRVMRLPFGWIAQPCEELDEELAPRDPSPSGAAPHYREALPQPMEKIPPSELPGDAVEAVRLAAGLRSPPAVLSVERRQSPGFPRWRVETRQGIWRVTWSAQNGFVARRNPEDAEESPRLRRRKRWPRDPAGTMIDVQPEEMPDRVLEAIQEAVGAALPPGVLSASRRRGPGSPRWRVETEHDTWCVKHGPHGWIAGPSE